MGYSSRDRPTKPGLKFWLWWMLGTVAGVAGGTVLAMPVNTLLVAAVGSHGTGPWTTTQTALIIAFKGVEGGLVGLGLGLGQWLVFRINLERCGWWIAATAIGCTAQGVLRWNLPVDTPVLQVGTATMLSFGFLLGIPQWLVLRGRIHNAASWIPVSVAGWLLALVFAVASQAALLGIQSSVSLIWAATILLAPFGVAGLGMLWLLRRVPSQHKSILP